MAAYDYLPFLKRPAPKFVTEEGKEVHGIIAEFADPAAVYHAAERVRDAGYSSWDLHAPFPIHDIESAMGVKRTRLPILVAGCAFTGVFLALLMQWYMNYADFPQVVQGKPWDAWEPLTPVTFELGVLFSAFAALIGMLAFNGLPRFNHPLFNSDRFLKVSDDRFFIYIESSDPTFDPDLTRRLLEQAGGSHIDLITE